MRLCTSQTEQHAVCLTELCKTGSNPKAKNTAQVKAGMTRHLHLGALRCAAVGLASSRIGFTACLLLCAPGNFEQPCSQGTAGCAYGCSRPVLGSLTRCLHQVGWKSGLKQAQFASTGSSTGLRKMHSRSAGC